MANMNSLPLDWVARLSVGGSQHELLPRQAVPGGAYVPRPIWTVPSPGRPTYVEAHRFRAPSSSPTPPWEMEPYARGLGYEGPPFPLGRGPPPPPQMRVGRHLRPHVPPRPLPTWSTSSTRLFPVFLFLPSNATRSNASVSTAPSATSSKPTRRYDAGISQTLRAYLHKLLTGVAVMIGFVSYLEGQYDK